MEDTKPNKGAHGLGPGGAAAAILGGAAGLTAATLVWSKLMVDHRLPLPSAIEAPRESFKSHSAGAVSFYRDAGRGGRPLLLLHSVNAAASAREVEPLFEHLRGEAPVYALDLPGFGFSERADREYSPELYAACLIEFAEQRIGARAGGVDVAALSLSCEFVALAAARRPDLFRSLVFFSPTGFDRRHRGGVPETAFEALSGSVCAQAFFDLLVSRPSIRHFLQKSFAGRVDTRLAAYDFLSSHQPGARHAPFAFLSGRLFTPEILSIYDRVKAPTLVIANRDGFVSFDALPEFAAAHPHWRFARIGRAGSLPHFENLPDTAAIVDTFWRHLPEPALTLC